MITQEEKYGLDHELVKGVPTADAVSKWTGGAMKKVHALSARAAWHWAWTPRVIANAPRLRLIARAGELMDQVSSPE
jgi:phosphoglycerate dehydrogenase-like enzyme